MPSTYAHYRFGKSCLNVLEPNALKLVTAYRELYDIGLHGPDILFYYRPFQNNRINALGHKMHRETASQFFKAAKVKYQKLIDQNDKDAFMAYLLGFCSHYALDNLEHSYIEAKMKHSQLGHSTIEVAYDRYLLLKDGLDPFKVDLAAHIIPNDFNARILQIAFSDFTLKELRSTLKQMAFYLRLLTAAPGIKRKALIALMKVIKAYDHFKEQLMPLTDNPDCADSNLRLDKLTVQALNLFKELAGNLRAYYLDAAELSERFAQTFSYQENWQYIPVLDYEGEKKYEI